MQKTSSLELLQRELSKIFNFIKSLGSFYNTGILSKIAAFYSGKYFSWFKWCAFLEDGT